MDGGDVRKVVRTICLLNSMVESKEDHSFWSKRMVSEALVLLLKGRDKDLLLKKANHSVKGE